MSQCSRIMFVRIILCTLVILGGFWTVSCQQDPPCDINSNTTQCSRNEFCYKNPNTSVISCKTILPCDSTNQCGPLKGTACVLEVCQPDSCNATGQCVHGFVCSQNIDYRSCRESIEQAVEHDTNFVLKFESPAQQGTYEEISWYEGSALGSDRIVWLHSLTGGEPLYYGDYCSDGSSSCNTSEKGSLDKTTGEFTINQVELSDEGFYYYKFYSTGGTTDTGYNYEYHIEVYVKPAENDIQISGVPGGVVGEGTLLNLNCTVDRIKPKSSLFWTINGVRKNATTIDTNNTDGTYKQETYMYQHTVTREDETISCSVEKLDGYWEQSIPKSVTVNPGYGPSGQPDIEPNIVEKYVNQLATLECNNLADAGNPPCTEYTWRRIEGDVDDIPDTQRYTFQVDESNAGNYTCRCKNQFNTSDESAMAQVILLEGVPPPTEPPNHDGSTGGVDAAIIGGAVGGAVVLILLVVVIVIFIMRRRNKPKSIPDDENRMVHKNGSAKQPEEPTYAQPDKTRKLRPHRGIRNDGKGIDGPQYMNTKELQGEGENPYENTSIDNNNPPAGKQENGITPEVVYTEVKIGENGVRPVIPGRPGTKPKPKPKPTERTSVKKPKINQNEEPTVYAEIKPQPLVKKDEEN